MHNDILTSGSLLEHDLFLRLTYCTYSL